MQLVYHPDKVLRTKCNEVDIDRSNHAELENIGRQMLEIMYNNNGIGLAYPQVGGTSRILVMKKGKDDIICINPEVEKLSSEMIRDMEGCLSFPDLWIPVLRARTILAKWYNPLGNVQREFFSDYNARCFQHEVDHLDGICFDGRVSKLVLNMAKKKQRKSKKYGR